MKFPLLLKRYAVVIKGYSLSISGVYSSEFEDDDVIKEVRQMADNFEELEGRRPRIMIAKMGQDGHDRGAKVIATSFADMGFDGYRTLFQTQKKQHKMRWIMTSYCRI